MKHFPQTTPSRHSRPQPDLRLTRSRLTAIAALIWCSLVSVPLATAATPVIFFSDLGSGPRTGGEKGAGVWITIYGRNFGVSQGSSVVRIGTTPASEYKYWTDTKVAFQLPAATPTGNQSISISVGGSASNSVPFKVATSGNIYCVSTSGNDSNSGRFASGCWRSVQHAIDVMQPGDTVYVRQGIVETKAVSANGSVSIGAETVLTGTADRPVAIAGYPGETAQIGAPGNGPCESTTCVEGLLTYNNELVFSYFTIANLTLRGNNTALAITGRSKLSPPRSTNWRIIGNDVSCPYGNGAAGCVETSEVDNVSFLGNNVHDVGWTGASTLYQAVYFSSDSSHVEVGWNTITHVNGCYGIQFHSSPLLGGDVSDPTGHQQFDLSVHDNTISDTQCSGIMFATVDPSRGKVEAFNNVIFNAGRGPGSGGGSFFCIDFPGYANQPPAGRGTAEVYNNTLYNCGSETVRSRLGPGWGGAISSMGPANGQPELRVRLRNNIIVQPSQGEYYWSIFSKSECSSSCGNIFGTNNLFYGLEGNGTTRELTNPNLAVNIRADPLFANPQAGNFHLQAGSPARSTGVSLGLAYDLDGLPRAVGRPPDLGAYSLAARRLADVTCSPQSIVTPGSSTCVIQLTAGQLDNTVIAVGTDSPNVTAPTTVAVSPDAVAVSVTAQASLVRSTQTAALLFSLGLDSVSFTLNLVPPATTFVDRIENAGTLLTGPVSPGQVTTIFGFGLGPPNGVSAQVDTGGRVVTNLAGTTVRFDGVPAPLTWVQANQINLVVPFSLASRTATEIQVESNGSKSNVFVAGVVATNPAVFTSTATGIGQAAAINENGMLNAPESRVARGSTVALWVTGLGLTDPPLIDGYVNSVASGHSLLADVTVKIGEQTAELAYVGPAPSLVAGVYQINARIPQTIAPGNEVPVFVTAGNSVSQSGVTIAVR